MRFSLRPQITFKNIKISYQSQLRFLGIYITEKLMWGSHAQSLRTKLCKVVYMMKILKETMSPYVIRNIYYSNSHSRLRYGTKLLDQDSENNKMFKLQKKALQIISGVSYINTVFFIYTRSNVLLKNTKTVW
jgi:hypothetical protein